ncbi:hypothetical protein ACSQ67_019099 [Phaseolus vulgaris]
MSSSNLRDLQRDLENKANDLSKLQKGTLTIPPIYYLSICFHCSNSCNEFFFAEIAKNHQMRKKYTIQLGENELVLKLCVHRLCVCFHKELDLLREDANVYKLIGPVLVKQDLAEANANVRKRIEYISAEL